MHQHPIHGIHPNNLPVSLTSLIGREQEVKAIHALLLRPDVRLLTLTGTAGVGKTRLALEVAQDLMHDFADGVYFVSLAPINDPAQVIPTIAHSLGLIESGSQPVLDILKLSQRDKQRLLILDNFEQVITAVPLLSELLEACLYVKILVTSREVFHLRAEHQFVLPPLALPDPKHLPDERALADIPAVNLFLQRAQAIRSDFQLTRDNASTIAEICTRLDGLPLAIELAAARIKLFPPQALLARLDHRLHILTGGARDLPERQQTLRNTLAWSYELLTAEEQCLFRRLSVFVGGCTLEAIEAVCAVFHDGTGQILDEVASLLDKSLLQQTEQEDHEPRIFMLETIREYGFEALATSGEMEITRQAHAAYYLRLSEEADPELQGPQQLVWLQRLEQEHENLRAAMQWLLEQAEDEGAGQRKEMALRLGTALRQFWMIYGYISEGRSFLEQALTARQGIAVSVRAKALQAAASLAVYIDDTEQAERLCEESLTLCRELGDRAGIAFSLYQLGMLADTTGNPSTAHVHTEEALALSREVGDTTAIAWSLLSLAKVVGNQGEYSSARALFEESLVMHRALGNKRGIANSLFRLSWVILVSQGDPAPASVLLEEGLALFRELNDKGNMAQCISLSGRLALSQGETSAGRSLLEESMMLFKELGSQWGIAESLAVLGQVEAKQGDLAAARTLYEKSLTIAREYNYKDLLPSCLEGLAAVAAAQGEPVRAVWFMGAAQALREAIGTPLPSLSQAMHELTFASTRSQLGEQAFDAAWAEGRTMTPEDILLSLEPTPALEPPLITSSSATVAPQSPAGLTTREMDVLRLLAQGLTSAQIAERLVIGLVTVNSHVRSIYSKLGVTSRAAATRYALEHHLL